MTQRRMSPLYYRALASIAALTLCSALSGCGSSDGQREYTVPSSLCGTPIGGDALDPFFSPGKEISTSEKDGSSIKSCSVTVDNKVIITTTQEWVEGEKSTAYFAAALTLEDLDHSHDNGRFLYTATEAFGKTRNCVDERYERELYVGIQVWDPEHKDAEGMKQAIVAYTGEVEQSAECTEGFS
ncbi:hypothetical protein AB0O01_23075 [Streptomyces sp. NPDC093252]|uniref:hypothetical protein n=1 Tax=Streptomyces sp. NPDC093252 TaxID=3154980 RepID=UPI00341A50A9